MPFNRKSEEEKMARAEQRNNEALERDRQREEADREKLRQAFLASPAGRARLAFERGDKVFQYALQIGTTQAVVIPMATARTISTSSDPTAILNSVANEGWDLVNGSFIFLHLGEESRDKFMASGQQVAVRGAVNGYYLFRRCDANKTQEVEELRVGTRECPNCSERIPRDASLCPQCGTESEPWVLRDGRWMVERPAGWLAYDDSSRTWNPA